MQWRRRTWKQAWSAPLVGGQSYVSEGRFQFLGELGVVRSAGDWNQVDKSKLWLYNLHYLDDLNTAGADERYDQLQSLINQWNRENLPMAGNGWEPYPLSIRLVNLVKWYGRQVDPGDDALTSLQRQAKALEAQLEWHILANHLFANAKALTFAGSFYSDALGNKWLNLGLRILDKELKKQFFHDGGHFELSPMYHSTLLWDLCDLVNLADRSGVPELLQRAPEWRRTIERGLLWLRAMSHPDGEIAFFNDSAFGIAPKPCEIEDYAAILDVNVSSKSSSDGVVWRHLTDSGYIAIEQPRAKLILDVGEVGPAYQPGHAHADTLSFELSLFGVRVFVNSGISTYDIGTDRNYQRGTAAHNTLEINGENSSEVWAGFRVARRASPFGLFAGEKNGTFHARCSHNGYRWLPKAPNHKRSWQLSSNRLEVLDTINGAFETAIAYFHLHPDIDLDSQNRLWLATGQVINWHVQGGVARVVDSSWSPRFGSKVDSRCIEVHLEGSEIKTSFWWH